MSNFLTTTHWIRAITICLGFAIVSSSCAQTELATVDVDATDWPWWRGPERNGVADATQMPPTSWSETKNVLWRVPVPGRGHASPTVLGNEIFLPTADQENKIQSVICFDAETGKMKWVTAVHKGGFGNDNAKKANEKASFASSTIATDGKLLFVNFFHADAAHTTALDLAGKIIWQQKICDYKIHQGYGSSPAIYGPLVIVSADNKSGGAILGLDRQTGEPKWRRNRPQKPNYVSPAILSADGRDQLIFSGCDLVTSLDPLTGELNWEIEGATTECVTTAVTDGTHVFTSGGYPKNHISAVLADGSGEVVWETNTRNYVPSLLQRDGFLYATLDEGIATCIRCDTGKVVWKSRLGGTFTSSPVMVGDLIYAANEVGDTHIFKANAEKFESVAVNHLGDSVFATPTIVGGRIYHRVAHQEGVRRQEYLYSVKESD